MSEQINNVVVNISRDTQTVPQASFGVPAVIARFPTGKTTVPFSRYRTYRSIEDVLADGWKTHDDVYKIAVLIFTQLIKCEKFAVGRLNENEPLTTGLAAIQEEDSNWYAWSLLASTKKAEIVFASDLVAENVVDITLGEVTVPTVSFSTDMATTMANIITAIETADATIAVTIDATNSRKLLLESSAKYIAGISAVVTLGISQATVFAYRDLNAELTEAALWNETQLKLLSIASSRVEILDTVDETDLFSQFKSLGHTRTFGTFTLNSQETASPDFIEIGWLAECLPFDSGSQTWAYKTIKGVTVSKLNSIETSAIISKYGNFYTNEGNVDVTQPGKVFGNEWIDIIRGVDFLQTRIKEAIWELLVTKRKTPYTDDGIATIESKLNAVLIAGAEQGILVSDTIVIVVPDEANIAAIDKANREVPGIEWSAQLQGAIQIVTINGTVTL